MGKLAVYKYVATMFLTIQILLTLFTFMGLFGGNVTPVGNTARAMCVYVLPLLIIANFIMLIYWLIRRRWWFSLIPIVTLTSCIPYSGTIFQFSFDNPQENTESGLRVASYNVAMFGRETSGFMAQDILAEMRRQKIDVLCIQEYNEISGDKNNSESYKEYFPYMQVGREDMVIFSRYPITGHKTILFEETNNSAMWADIDVKGKAFRIFNIHLETTGINRTLHSAGKIMAQQHQQVDDERNDYTRHDYDSNKCLAVFRLLDFFVCFHSMKCIVLFWFVHYCTLFLWKRQFFPASMVCHSICTQAIPYMMANPSTSPIA